LSDTQVKEMAHIRFRKIVALLALCSCIGAACSTIPPTETNGPRANEPLYPVILANDPNRDSATLAATKQIAAQPGLPSANVTLQPITGTIRSLPANGIAMYLPKLGTATEMTEEETRESLRRFINEWQNIIGADPEELSLVTRTDEPDGTKLATYDQRPFRYPLRGGDYGKLQIRFASDRRVLDIMSTCIPDADKLQQTLAAVNPVVKPEDASRSLSENGINYTDANGQGQFLKPAVTDIDPRELVIYVSPSPAANALEFRLAWEVLVKNAPVKIVFLDAVKNQILATI
jgi:hypothetical protein